LDTLPETLAETVGTPLDADVREDEIARMISKEHGKRERAGKDATQSAIDRRLRALTDGLSAKRLEGNRKAWGWHYHRLYRYHAKRAAECAQQALDFGFSGDDE